MQTNLLLFIFLLIGAVLQGQTLTQTVRGTVLDADVKSPLIGAIIILDGADPAIGTTTDFDGHFRLENVPVGRHNFIIRYTGYEEVYMRDIVVASGREAMFNVEMVESVTSLKEVTVVANADKSVAINQVATVCATQITVEETSRVAAGISDPGRTAQSVAGVSSADDEGNELVIRGNSPRGFLWRMEGIEIPNPNHFSNGEGGTGGGVCALSTQVLDNSDFFTGAFPGEYGNALSGVFDLHLRAGNTSRREYSVQLGVLGAQASLEGPFKQGGNASYLINYRYSTLEMLSKIGIDISGGDIVPKWQDLSFKLVFPTKKAGRFSLWGLGGISSAGSTITQDTALWMYRGDRFRDTEDHTLGVAGLTHQYIFKNNKTYLKTVAAFSHTNDQIEVDSMNYELASTTIEQSDFIYNTLSISSYIHHRFNVRNSLRAGVIFHNRAFDSKGTYLNFETDEFETQIDDKGSTVMLEEYVQWMHRFSNDFELNAGLHYTYLAVNDDVAFEPRLGARWKATDRSTFSFGAGLHSRVEPISLYLGQQMEEDGTYNQPNLNLKLTKAAHLVLGYGLELSRDIRFKAEVYYQYLYDVPVKIDDTTNVFSALNFSSGFTNAALVNDGKGRNYGMELTLQKFFSNAWYGYATASVFESKYTMPDGVERNTAFNSNYIFNLVGGKEWTVGRQKTNVFGANFRGILRGGYRTVPIDLAASIDMGEEVLDFDRAYETKVPDYFRMDIGVSYRRNHPNWSWVLSLDIQNVTGRLNVYNDYYSAERMAIETNYMNGLIPILNYRVEF